eukprot:NODE_2743_length_884_cov_334.201448.p1 GENE.NODE_2743_length_884_cov_334.201448~~NODE_2743_length_884_cov_334.201448.p1  ORF type:complete len:245 (+),score=42.63 NODE_2743_length_884_cov_334.201448:3-737(+)
MGTEGVCAVVLEVSAAMAAPRLRAGGEMYTAMDDDAVERLRADVQRRLRRLLLLALPMLDAAAEGIAGALARIRGMVRQFEGRTGLGAGQAEGGKQWLRIAEALGAGSEHPSEDDGEAQQQRRVAETRAPHHAVIDLLRAAFRALGGIGTSADVVAQIRGDPSLWQQLKETMSLRPRVGREHTSTWEASIVRTCKNHCRDTGKRVKRSGTGGIPFVVWELAEQELGGALEQRHREKRVRRDASE